MGRGWSGGRVMEIEKTLVLLKPGNFERRLEVFTCLDDLLREDFTKTNSFHVHPVPAELIKAHYEDIKGKPFYDWTVKAFLESREGIILRVYSGNNIIERSRKAIGNTDPKKAKQGTIRQRFSNDSLDIAFREKRYLNNVIHASDSLESSERERKIWRPYIMLG